MINGSHMGYKYNDAVLVGWILADGYILKILAPLQKTSEAWKVTLYYISLAPRHYEKIFG